MKKILIKILTMAILLTLLFSEAAFGENDDIYVRVRIRYPRLFNEQVSFEGYDEIVLYDENDELLSLNNNLILRIDTYYAGNYYLSDISQGLYGPCHALLRDEIYSSYDEAYIKAEELEEEFNSAFYPYLIEDGYIIAGGNYADKGSAEDLADELKIGRAHV